jgi:ribA/ribD-fused uncharacterized protein
MIDKFDGPNRYLSNFGPGQIVHDNKVYETAEHLYQALKTLDPEEHEFVRKSPTPGEAKKRGKKITLREDWDQVKDEIMRMILDLKFSQNPELMEKLLATGDQELIEGNWWGDTYWGVCFGSGQNKLGLLLQEVRSAERKKRDPILASDFKRIIRDRPLTPEEAEKYAEVREQVEEELPQIIERIKENQ